MSIYICSKCKTKLDGDYSPCYEYDEKEVCEECYQELVDMFGCHDEDPAYIRSKSDEKEYICDECKGEVDDYVKTERPDWDMNNTDYL